MAALSSTVQPINEPGAWDYFIGHSRRSAEAVGLVERLYSSLLDKGKTVWLDVYMTHKSLEAMEEGVKQSACFIAVITGPCVNNDRKGDPPKGNAYFRRGNCIKELRWAQRYRKPIVPVLRIEDKQDIGTFLNLLDDPVKVDRCDQVVADLKALGNTDWIDLNRDDGAYWEVGLEKVLQHDGIILQDSLQSKVPWTSASVSSNVGGGGG
eukprot:g3664.t1